MLTDNPPPAITSNAQLDAAAIRRSLAQHLKEREDIIRELAASAAPNVDPIAWTTTASTRRVVHQIVAAMDRLDAGTYGRCIRCGGAIVAARLEVLPYAETCIGCQNAVENAG